MYEINHYFTILLPPPSHLNKGESGNLEPVQFVHKIQTLPLVSFVLVDGECGGPGPVQFVHNTTPTFGWFCPC